MKTGPANPKAFYSGLDQQWATIEAGFDIPRRVSDDILSECVISEIEDEAKGGTQLVLLRGPAGNGKTIALKRIAWDAAGDYDKLVLYLRESGTLKREPLEDLMEKTSRRIFLFVDHVALHVDEMLELLSFAKRGERSLTVIVSERDHEWHSYCGSLGEYVDQEFSIRYLSDREIHRLLAKLDEHNYLGILKERSYEDRFRQFHDHAGRQLLVALHELTLGRRFEDIVHDEYERIVPINARYLYLDVCSLNKFAVPVRAGTIARVSNISFRDFKSKLFDPLKNVVRNYFDKGIHDYVYTARHPHVAEIVFDTVLASPEDKFDQLIRILGGINLGYSSDAVAFREIIRSATLISAFPAIELAHRFYDRAIDLTEAGNPHVFQQAAILELNHPAGTLTRSSRLLENALNLAPHDPAIQHTLANLRRRQALTAKTELEATVFRQDARRILIALRDRPNSQPFEYHTLAQISLDELRETLAVAESASDAENGTFERRVGDLVTEVETSLRVGLQKFPDDEQLYALEAEFRDVMAESERAELALMRAFDLNERKEFIAVRLARQLTRRGDIEGAKKILFRCIDARPQAKFAHLEVAQMYMDDSTKARDIVIEHLRRSTTKGDPNYIAQYLLARELFLDGKQEEAYEWFESLSDGPMSSREKSKVRYILKESGGSFAIWHGEVRSLRDAFCFIDCGSCLKAIFAFHRNSAEENWRSLRANQKVRFSVGFNMRGPTAIDVMADD